VGRRPGNEDTREVILQSARTAFAEQGYSATSVRDIAKLAAVDPSLVIYYFGSKERLFEAAMQFPFEFSETLQSLAAGGIKGIGQRIIRFVLTTWDDPVSRQPLVAMLRSAVSTDEGANMLRGFLTDVMVDTVAAIVDAPDARLRATLMSSHLTGIVILRYIVRMEPLASADIETLVDWLAPAFQGYLVARSRER
jgi:AcrR family transcriptional regulator